MADPVTAPPPLTDRDAALILIEIRRLYALLEQVPYKAKPKPGDQRTRTSGPYAAMEIQIRGLSDQYRAWEATQPTEKCRMAKARLTAVTDDDDRRPHPRRHPIR